MHATEFPCASPSVVSSVVPVIPSERRFGSNIDSLLACIASLRVGCESDLGPRQEELIAAEAWHLVKEMQCT